MPALGLVLLLAVVAGGCGAESDPPPAGADRFDGSFQIVAVDRPEIVDPLSQLPQLLIGTEFGDLEVLPGCNTYYGSFTLTDDGTASFTVTGGTDLDCGLLDPQEDAILAALDATERWEETAEGFVFVGPDSRLEVRRLNSG
jgi:heat shock protein HslJ